MQRCPPGGLPGDFYPRPPRGGRPTAAVNLCLAAEFLSTPSARRATCRFSADCGVLRNFYPRPPRGGRLCFLSIDGYLLYDFYPRPPRGGRRPLTAESKSHTVYFYPRPPRGGRLGPIPDAHAFRHISIHALREEGDVLKPRILHSSSHFYPRPPRGGRQVEYPGSFTVQQFLSTPSARRATESRM